MRVFAEVTQGEDPYRTGRLCKDIGGQVCRRKHRSTLGNVTSARDLPQTFTSWEELSTLSPALGRLLSGGWTLSALFLRPWGTRSTCWLARITSLNGLKRSLWLISEMWMLRSLSGRIFSCDLELHGPLSRITAFNLTAMPLGSTVQNWASRIDIPLRPVLKETGKQKLLIKL